MFTKYDFFFKLEGKHLLTGAKSLSVSKVKSQHSLANNNALDIPDLTFSEVLSNVGKCTK